MFDDITFFVYTHLYLNVTKRRTDINGTTIQWRSQGMAREAKATPNPSKKK